MKQIIITCTLLLLLISTPTLSQQLSDQAKISLLTMGPTQELYNQFGHTAIRVHDPVNGIDVCYNYGTYSFDTPNFYGKFVSGTLPYMLADTPTRLELRYYQQIGRGVKEQVFNITPEEANRVYDFILENYKEENRFYLYHFFYDNCATRIRDLFEDVLDIRFHYPGNVLPEKKSFRQLLDEKIEMTPWNDFGIDFILGSPADLRAGFREEMFLPDYLSKNIGMATYKGKPLLSPPVTLVEHSIEVGSKSFLTPFNVFGILFLLTLLLTFRGSEKLKKRFDLGMYSILGFCGLFLLFMRLGTDHFTTWKNYNMLWANPLYVFAIIHFFYPKPWLQSIKWLILIMAFNNLVISVFPPQDFHVAIYPILGIVITRLMDNMDIWAGVKNRFEPTKGEQSASGSASLPLLEEE